VNSYKLVSRVKEETKNDAKKKYSFAIFGRRLFQGQDKVPN
jgi:hypothetical protein